MQNIAGQPLATYQVEYLRVEVYADRASMGQAAAQAAGLALRQALEEHAQAQAIFAAAPSQNELLDNLVRSGQVDWTRVRSFHLDEYIGLPASAPQSFRNFLTSHLWGQVDAGPVEMINGDAPDAVDECRRYGDLLKNTILDLACIGIGENGHIAFNDPHVADFQDPYNTKIVDLDEASRRQQVNDGCFARLEEVPAQAITVTIPPIMAARQIVCVVPGIKKAEAVRAALTGPVDLACPASILRRNPRSTLYLDRAAASLLTIIG